MGLNPAGSFQTRQWATSIRDIGTGGMWWQPGRAELRFCKAIRNRRTSTPALEEYFMKYKPTKDLVCRPWGKPRPQLSDKTCKREVRHLAAAGSGWARQTNKPQLDLNGYPLWSLQLPYRIPKQKAFLFVFETTHVTFQPHKAAEKALTNWM